MKNNLLLTILLLFAGLSLQAQYPVFVEFTRLNQGIPSGYVTTDFSLNCTQSYNSTIDFRVEYDHCLGTNLNCVNGCGANPFRYTFQLYRNNSVISTQSFTSSGVEVLVNFFNIPRLPGVYKVKVKFERRRSLCIGWETLTNRFTNDIEGIEVSPAANFDSVEEICLGETFSVNYNTNSNISHEWYYYPSNGSPGNPVCNTANCSITASNAGNYIITHKLITPCGSSTYSRSITVNALPTPTVLNTAFCETETSGNLLYSPLGGTMSGPGVFNNGGLWRFNASVAGPGVHTITYTLEDELGCVGSSTAQVAVDAEIQTVSFSHDSNICQENGNLLLEGNPSGGSWSGTGVILLSGSWYFNPSGLTGEQILTYTVSSPNGVCTTTQNTSIFVDDPVSFSPTIPWPEVCINETVEFIANPTNSYSHNLSISWDFGSTASPNSANSDSVNVSFTQAGQATILLEGENACGVTQYTYTLPVSAPLTGLAITTPNPFCGATNLTSNYIGPDPLFWSGNGVSPLGQISNPSADVVAVQINANIDNACQDSFSGVYLQYREKEITPIQFCTYDQPVLLNADIASGPWLSAANTQYPNVAGSALDANTGFFEPGNVNPSTGDFRVVHQSVCNKVGILTVLPGSPQSTSEWPKHFDDLGTGNESGTDVARTDEDAYYITGTFSGSLIIDPNAPPLASVGGDDIFVAKYTECGLVWAESFGSTGNDHSPAISWDMGNSEESIYVSGTIAGNTTIPGSCSTCNLVTTASSKGFIAKFDENGVGVWASIPTPSNTELNSFRDIHAFGNQVVVTGDFIGSITLNGPTLFAIGGPTDHDILAISLEDFGSGFTNEKLIARGSQNNDQGNGIVIEPGGSTYVTGYATLADLEPNYFPQNSGGTDIFLGAINSNFQWDWVNLYGGPNNDEGMGIAAESQVVITGYVEGDVDMGNGIVAQTNNQSIDAFIMNVQASGSTNWFHLGGSSLNLDRGTDVAITQNQVAMIGHFSGTAFVGNIGPISSVAPSDQDIFLATFDVNTGSDINLSPIKGIGLDQAHGIAAQPNSPTFLFTGDFQDNLELIQLLTASPSTTDMYAGRYDPMLASIFFKSTAETPQEPVEAETATEIPTLLKAYPNPTSSLLTIELVQSSSSDLEIFDMTGRLLERITSIPEGEFKTELDFTKYPAGIYLIRVVSDDQRMESLRVVKQ
ncbi:MAG: T9SS type A sorting domain-containing protein [Bacteroidota bacterium]